MMCLVAFCLELVVFVSLSLSWTLSNCSSAMVYMFFRPYSCCMVSRTMWFECFLTSCIFKIVLDCFDSRVCSLVRCLSNCKIV
ncbi:hypothetical protein Hdeb2414_s0020g00562591 [Helianthus debilis subsp. tardiflorus]